MTAKLKQKFMIYDYSKHGRVIVAVAALLIAGGLKIFLESNFDTQSVERFPRIAWPAGERQVYRISYRSEDRVRPIVDDGMQSAVADPWLSTLSLDAQVALTGVREGDIDDTTRVVFQVLSCDTASWEIAGGVAWANPQACTDMLVGSSLGADMAETGEIMALYDPSGAKSSTQSILQTLLLRMQITLPSKTVSNGEQYRAQEKTLQGTADNFYKVRLSEGIDLTRETHSYSDLRVASGLTKPPKVDASGNARFVINPRWLLKHIHGHEKLTVKTADGVSILASETKFEFQWLRSEAAPQQPSSVAYKIGRPPTSIRVGANLQKRLLEKRIAGLNQETLVQTLTVFGNGGVIPDQARFLWRATGLLEQQPKASWELLELYRNPDASSKLKGLVLDLLSSAGHDEAQKAMREVLNETDDLIHGDPAARQQYQRLGLLQQPTIETAQMVHEHYRKFLRDNDVEAQLTSAYSLGAIVAKLSQGTPDQQALVSAYNDELVQDLNDTFDPVLRAHKVTALGNTKLEINTAVLSGLATDQNSLVRQRVAYALGRIPATTPPKALLELLSDDDRIVQRNAVRGSTPHDNVYQQVKENIETGRLAQLNVRPILDLVKRGRHTNRASTDALLETLLANGITDDKDRELAILLQAM